ncbi:hypothetical protein DRQ25_00310 [Candidatus Fermentibacteria bacterium]|nr:MAG: hypothetical protein DRQ25_00310 [Candidatus Fermentibacteria bacterium]
MRKIILTCWLLLLFSGIATATVDFTTFTEVDPNEHITATSSKVSFNCTNDEIAYIYRDYGLTYFSSWEINLTFNIEAMDAIMDGLNLIALSSETSNISSLGSQDFRLFVTPPAGSYYISLESGDGEELSELFDELNDSQNYYLTLVGTDTNVTVSIYADPNRTIGSLVGTLSIPVATQYRYMILSSSIFYGDEGDSGWWQGYITNMSIETEAVPTARQNIEVTSEKRVQTIFTEQFTGMSTPQDLLTAGWKTTNEINLLAYGSIGTSLAGKYVHLAGWVDIYRSTPPANPDYLTTNIRISPYLVIGKIWLDDCTLVIKLTDAVGDQCNWSFQTPAGVNLQKVEEGTWYPLSIRKDATTCYVKIGENKYQYPIGSPRFTYGFSNADLACFDISYVALGKTITNVGDPTKFCEEGYELFGDLCCPIGTIAMGDLCCPPWAIASHGLCCPEGTIGISSEGICCPEERTIGDGEECCPEGSVVRDTECCPNTGFAAQEFFAVMESSAKGQMNIVEALLYLLLGGEECRICPEYDIHIYGYCVPAIVMFLTLIAASIILLDMWL